MFHCKTVKIFVFFFLLSGCATAQKSSQEYMPPENYYEPVPQTQEPRSHTPQYENTHATNTAMPKTEIFFNTFCAQHGVPYKSDACRNIFLKEWVQAGGDLSKEGFAQIDKFIRTGSRMIGEKWGEYAREFRQGAKQGWRKK